MKEPAPRISLAEAEDAVRRSGYLLEARIESVFCKARYYVEANAAYPDPTTGKSRELDVYAMGATRAGPQDHKILLQRVPSAALLAVGNLIGIPAWGIAP